MATTKTKMIQKAKNSPAAARKKTRKATARKASSSGSDAAVSLRLDTAIYSKAALTRAVRAFSNLAEITVRREGNHHVITFGSTESVEAERLGDEFANYALGCLAVES